MTEAKSCGNHKFMMQERRTLSKDGEGQMLINCIMTDVHSWKTCSGTLLCKIARLPARRTVTVVQVGVICGSS
jgi:hypothetical protein